MRLLALFSKKPPTINHAPYTCKDALDVSLYAGYLSVQLSCKTLLVQEQCISYQCNLENTSLQSDTSQDSPRGQPVHRVKRGRTKYCTYSISRLPRAPIPNFDPVPYLLRYVSIANFPPGFNCQFSTGSTWICVYLWWIITLVGFSGSSSHTTSKNPNV